MSEINQLINLTYKDDAEKSGVSNQKVLQSA